ncbi:MAG: FkbM family methyltransferase [Planctomycetaceae bacterium]
MAYGAYERSEVALLRRFLRRGDVSVDIGANVGYISAHMAQQVGPEGRVYSFEPGPTPFRSLIAVKESNAFKNMEVFQVAVADTDRVAIYYETESILAKGYGRIDNHPSDRFQNVQAHETNVTSLTAFFASRPIDRLRLIKIDVEGHEKQVIGGLTGLLDRNVRPVILTEISIRGQAEVDFLDYRQLLRRYGYEMFAIGKSLSRVDPQDIKRGFHGNVAWVAG